MTNDTPEWLTVSQAAEFLGVHPNTVSIWLDEGRINGWKTAAGTRRIYRDRDLRRARDEHAARKRAAEA